MAIAMDLPELAGLRPDMECAVEIVPPRWIDDDELIELEQRYDGLHFERFADGTLLVTPMSGWQGGARDAEISRQVANWVRSGDHGLCMGPSGGVKLADGAAFAPDSTYVSRERWARTDRNRTLAEVSPDAAFEVLSKSDRPSSTMKKILGYLRNGVRLVVLIDPKRRKVYVGREGDAEPSEVGDVDAVDCSPVMPGFVLDVAAIRDAGLP
ncbi:MAG TPA: Uma2 family endonuclease [Candidatus Elarobacter sp.]|jgi:Uma2 family endonuclease|nr:Uma2 family endonuclease [Candidatus Elarobacter sp.]